MPSLQEYDEVLAEVALGLSLNAVKRMLVPWLISWSPANEIKFWRTLMHGEDKDDLAFATAVRELVGAMMNQSALVTLEDLGLTLEQISDMAVPKLRQLLEEDWAPEMERMAIAASL